MLLKDALGMTKKQLLSVTEEASPEAALLLTQVTGFSHAKQLAYPETTLTEAQSHLLEDLIRKRLSGVPIQYIIGEAGFMGLMFQVTPAVLIPRPETEQLVELSLYLLGIEPGRIQISRFEADFAESGLFEYGRHVPRWENHPVRVLDIGTGSGCIPIALLAAAMRLKCTNLSVTAIDISPAALAIARANAQRYLPPGSIRFIEKNVLDAYDPEEPFDLILSNPPYIPTEDILGLMREVKDQEPFSALDGGEDGLLFYRCFAKNLSQWLAPRGVLLVEIGVHQEHSIRKLFSEMGFSVCAFQDDQKIPRILCITKQFD